MLDAGNKEDAGNKDELHIWWAGLAAIRAAVGR